jgi:3'-5' exoribonuclease
MTPASAKLALVGSTPATTTPAAAAAATPPAFAPGDRVHHQFLVVERAEKTQSNGDPFVVLTLSTAAGQIACAPIWMDKLEWADGVVAGKVVQAIGTVTVYAKTGRKQIQLSSALRVIPDELVDPRDFLPSIGDCTKLWDWIDRTRNEIRSPRLRRVVDLFFGDDAFRVQFEQTPGSTAGHHAKIGGLLLHVFEVTSIAKQTARTMKADVDLVVTGALLHDVGKVESYTVGAGGFTFTPCGLLLGHVVLGALMLERRLAKLGEPVCSEGQLLELQHMILSHHGKQEFGSPVSPMTTEAEIVHWADEASAKANDMMESLEDEDAFPDGGEFSKKVWRVGRKIWRRPHAWD